MLECHEKPLLRHPAQHAYWLNDWLRHSSGDDDHGYRSLIEWLDMLAGLTELGVDDPYGGMCAGDPDLENALAKGADSCRIAATRLLFAASALHSALCIVEGGQPVDERLEQRLSMVLADSPALHLTHSDCLLEQLRPVQGNVDGHDANPDPRGNAVAQAGVAFWHDFVSRGFRTPEPVPAGDSFEPGGQDDVVKIHAATTCLLLTIHRLLVIAMDQNNVDPYEETFESARDALWIVDVSGEGQWVESPQMRDALTALHLEVG